MINKLVMSHGQPRGPKAEQRPGSGQLALSSLVRINTPCHTRQPCDKCQAKHDRRMLTAHNSCRGIPWASRDKVVFYCTVGGRGGGRGEQLRCQRLRHARALSGGGEEGKNTHITATGNRCALPTQHVSETRRPTCN